MRCSFRNAALQKLHCNIRFSAVRTSFVTKAALQQTENCTATSKSLRCRKVALSCRFPAGFKPPRLGTHVSDLLNLSVAMMANRKKITAFSDRNLLGNKIQPESFLTEVILNPPGVMDVRAEMLVFQDFEGLTEVFAPRMSAGISAWTSARYPAPKLILWVAFWLLNRRPQVFRKNCRNIAACSGVRKNHYVPAVFDQEAVNPCL